MDFDFMMLNKYVIYADENVGVAIVEGLRRRGIAAYSCHDFKNFGFSDQQQIEFAMGKCFVILTHDTDFLRYIHGGGIEHQGVLFVAEGKLTVGEIIRKIEYIVSFVTMDDMKNQIEFF